MLNGRCPAVRQRQASRISRGTDTPQRGIQRRRQTVPTATSATKDYLRAQPIRGGLSQPAKPSRESSVQIRLALLARDCRNIMRNPFDTRTRCLSSVQRVRTSQIRVVPSGALVPAGPSASRRIQLALRSSASVWELGQSRQPLLPGAQTVSTTQIRSTGNCVGERTQNCCGAACLPCVSPCSSCLRAFATSAGESGDSGAPGKESTQLRAKTSEISPIWRLCHLKHSGFSARSPPRRRQPNLDVRRSRTEPPSAT